MCAYFSKAADETSEAMKQAAKEALTGSKSDNDKMKAITRAYTTKRQYIVLCQNFGCKEYFIELLF